ncbi:hypothetical protein HG15A2_47850 [Adhaeretor mobilis]|uniref:Uncharacterized protein n=1 Tax=Adhaeretor mobilis TaxID=1930276 RepID=A0A517N2U3_9BACT|nr:hypothetical protein HG15A2_47850 [Adhaeretor mobilis]
MPACAALRPVRYISEGLTARHFAAHVFPSIYAIDQEGPLELAQVVPRDRFSRTPHEQSAQPEKLNRHALRSPQGLPSGQEKRRQAERNRPPRRQMRALAEFAAELAPRWGLGAGRWALGAGR